VPFRWRHHNSLKHWEPLSQHLLCCANLKLLEWGTDYNIRHTAHLIDMKQVENVVTVLLYSTIYWSLKCAGRCPSMLCAGLCACVRARALGSSLRASGDTIALKLIMEWLKEVAQLRKSEYCLHADRNLKFELLLQFIGNSCIIAGLLITFPCFCCGFDYQYVTWGDKRILLMAGPMVREGRWNVHQNCQTSDDSVT